MCDSYPRDLFEKQKNTLKIILRSEHILYIRLEHCQNLLKNVVVQIGNAVDACEKFQ